MEQLKAKLKKQGGFTMVELLIVVAIIAILVAVSIPMMNSALERSRHAVDQANVRDAIALASVEYVTNPDAFKTAQTFTYYVDANSQGYLVGDGEAAVGTDQAATPKCTCGTPPTDGLTVTITAPSGTDKKPTVTTNWRYDATANSGKGATVSTTP